MSGKDKNICCSWCYASLSRTFCPVKTGATYWFLCIFFWSLEDALRKESVINTAHLRGSVMMTSCRSQRVSHTFYTYGHNQHEQNMTQSFFCYLFSSLRHTENIYGTEGSCNQRCGDFYINLHACFKQTWIEMAGFSLTTPTINTLYLGL